MSVLDRSPENKYELVRRQVEGLADGFDIMRLRFKTVDMSIMRAENSLTGIHLQEVAQAAKTKAEKLAYDQEVRRAELESLYNTPAAESKLDKEVAELNSMPTQQLATETEFINQETMAAQARALIIESTHNFKLPG